jgi:hypothetical protein
MKMNIIFLTKSEIDNKKIIILLLICNVYYVHNLQEFFFLNSKLFIFL